MLHGSVGQLSVVGDRPSRHTVAALAARVDDVISRQRDVIETASELSHQTAISAVHVLLHLVPLVTPQLRHLSRTARTMDGV